MVNSAMILPGQDFAAAFNKTKILFKHRLHQHASFDIESLIGLVSRISSSSAYWSTQPIAADDGWIDQSIQTSLEDTVREIRMANSLVVLKDIEHDLVYGPVLKEALAILPQLVGPALQDDMLHGRATLLIASPRRITGYHIDAEANFLFQLHGSKVVHVFDGSDRTLLPEHELEAFYAGNLNGARYKPERQEDAAHYDFQPGSAVHVPVDWPHWVENGDDVSVSLSINYDLRSNTHRRKIYKVNDKIRKLGFSPSTPGHFTWRDAGKVAFFDSISRARSLLPH